MLLPKPKGWKKSVGENLRERVTLTLKKMIVEVKGLKGNSIYRTPKKKKKKGLLVVHILLPQCLDMGPRPRGP